ncbi:MAG TPA: undecaprenyl/decaprenyl-phosphate alpha-N-acetylglucosaminyl 1-phosphate transferase, partial [Ilumatobacteraceae bacterium]
MPDLGDYLSIGALAAVVTFAATPLVRRLARTFGWVAEPNARSVHTAPIPHIGGLAMFAGFLVAIGVAWRLDRFH